VLQAVGADKVSLRSVVLSVGALVSMDALPLALLLPDVGDVSGKRKPACGLAVVVVSALCVCEGVGRFGVRLRSQ